MFVEHFLSFNLFFDADIFILKLIDQVGSNIYLSLCKHVYEIRIVIV